MTQHKMVFSDACTDVLTYLASLDESQLRTVYQITEQVAPAWAMEQARTTANALHTLRECGLVDMVNIDDWVTWKATSEGRKLAHTSDANAGSVSPINNAQEGR